MQENEQELVESPAESAQEESGKLFCVQFQIPLADYTAFYEVMSRDALPKNQRKSFLTGLVEAGVGVIYFVAAASGAIESGPLSYLICAMLVLMGLYSMTYYKLFYKRALAKSVAKEYEKLSYLRSEIAVDFYPDKCVERVGEGKAEHLWSEIHSIRTTQQLYMIMLETKRCLLVPKSQIPNQLAQMDALIERVCREFKKPREQL